MRHSRHTRLEQYLAVLELAPGASVQEVKNAYRELCIIWHPDKHPERVSTRATQKLQALNEAYHWLMRHGNLRQAPSAAEAPARHGPSDASGDPRDDWWQSIGRAWQQALQRGLRLARPPSADEVERLFTVEALDVSHTAITDLSPLRRFTTLRTLACENTAITDLSPLSGLHDLRELDCWNTSVRSLEPLAALPHVRRLNCTNTQVDDLTPLQQMRRLRNLSCSATPIATLEPLRELTELEALSCGETRITSLEPLRPMHRLRVLYCSQTAITSLAPLRDLPNITQVFCADTHVPLDEIGRFKTAFPHCRVVY